MNNNIEQQIDDFLLGRLSEHDLVLFQQQLKTDEALAKRVKRRQTIIGGIETQGRTELKEHLKSIHKKHIPTQKTVAKKRRLMPYLAAAASILLLVLAFAWMMNQNGTKTNEELYANYFEPYDISGIQRSESEEQIIQLKQLYKTKQYKATIPLFESILKDDDAAPTSLLLGAGIAHLELNQPQKALAYFQQINENGDFNFEYEVLWYSALAHLKLNDIAMAQKLLETLNATPSADHHQEAKKMLNELKKN